MTETLRIAESRYERLEQISWWDQARLLRARVLVAGAGALGNEILKHLALVGVGRIVVVDLDRVEISNLSRSVLFRAADQGRPKAEAAAARLLEINPEIRVLPITGDLRWEVGLGLLRRMDLVLAGLDSLGSRVALNQMCWKVGVPWIDGGLGELAGQVRVFVPPDGACFECGLGENDYQQLSARYSCQLLPHVGTDLDAVPTTSTSASLIAAWQVQEALKGLHGWPLAASRGLIYHGWSHDLFRPQFSRRANCLAHDALGEVLPLPTVSCHSTVDELLALLRSSLGAEVEVEIDREILTGMSCGLCGHRRPCRQPLFRTAPEDLLCVCCGAECDFSLSHRLTGQPELADARLAELGIPPLHILTVRGRDGSFRQVELTGDKESSWLDGFLRSEDDPNEHS